MTKIKIEEKLVGEIIKVKSEVRNRTAHYIMAAFGLVAGLAWNDAIKSLIEYFFPQDQNNLMAKLIYALVITFIVAISSLYLIRTEKKERKNEEKDVKEKKKIQLKK